MRENRIWLKGDSNIIYFWDIEQISHGQFETFKSNQQRLKRCKTGYGAYRSLLCQRALGSLLFDVESEEKGEIFSLCTTLKEKQEEFKTLRLSKIFPTANVSSF